MVMIPGSEEQRGTDLRAALKGHTPFSRRAQAPRCSCLSLFDGTASACSMGRRAQGGMLLGLEGVGSVRGEVHRPHVHLVQGVDGLHKVALCC